MDVLSVCVFRRDYLPEFNTHNKTTNIWRNVWHRAVLNQIKCENKNMYPRKFISILMGENGTKPKFWSASLLKAVQSV